MTVELEARPSVPTDVQLARLDEEIGRSGNVFGAVVICLGIEAVVVGLGWLALRAL